MKLVLLNGVWRVDTSQTGKRVEPGGKNKIQHGCRLPNYFLRALLDGRFRIFIRIENRRGFKEDHSTSTCTHKIFERHHPELF
ncbi:MAG: hypothetical protein P4N60_20360 [Verrucomicrobiae bacterium]|nr:hypothetical protein [Verrucomicrobiae bacterium]